MVYFLCLIIKLFLHWFCSFLEVPYDCLAEADLLHSLIVRARFENNRFQKPKKQPETSSKDVDWFWYWNTQYIRIEIFTFRFCVLLRTQNSTLNMWDFLILFNFYTLLPWVTWRICMVYLQFRHVKVLCFCSFGDVWFVLLFLTLCSLWMKPK